MSNNNDLIISYFDELYRNFDQGIKLSTVCSHDELYGELYYYSVIKILNYLNITSVDHFLDIGSGLGKIVFQVFLTTQVASATGIEINNNRSVIANTIKRKIATQLPEIFNNRNLNLIHGDFLHYDFNNITIIYLCCTVFSTELLSKIIDKINTMEQVKKIISFRLLPNLNNFKLIKKIFVHGDWDYVACYLYG